MTPKLSRQLASDAITGAVNTGVVTRDFARTAYKKWEYGAPADDCRYGKERGIAVDCDCDGCRTIYLFLYFDSVVKRFGRGE